MSSRHRSSDLRRPARGRTTHSAATFALLSSCLASALVAACSERRGDAAVEDRPRNVLLFLADTLRADRLGCYGYSRETSRAIDALARTATVYDRSHPQSCWTIPSMISLMTSLYVTQEEAVLPDEYPVLAERMKEAGLATGAFLGNKALTVGRDFERGFDHCDTQSPNGRAVTMAERFLDWYRGLRRERGPDGPGFFAWVHIMDPHEPYDPDSPYARFHGNRVDHANLLPRWEEADVRVRALTGRDGPAAGTQVLPLDKAILRMTEQSNWYDGEVSATDAGFQMILDALLEAGELSQTLVVFTADHGEILYERPFYPKQARSRVELDGGLAEGAKSLMAHGHRAWFYEELWRVPLFFAGPGFPKGVRRHGLAANLDLYPTLLDVMGLPRPPHLQGESLRGGIEPKRDRIFAHGYHAGVVLETSGLKAIVQPHDMFERTPDEPAPVEIYDLASDPGEETDLAASRPADAARLDRLIREWRRTHFRTVETRVPPEAKEIMEQLGYR